ncbi:MAG: hypothetical protein IIB27_01475 [Chloroflexi bacterium]|nr:hypothetical protein [Chloroflexota bacterium]
MGITDTLASSAGLLLHSDYLDPTLLDWIRHKIDDVFGLGPETIVAVFGLMVIAFPIGLMALALRRSRRNRANRL